MNQADIVRFVNLSVSAEINLLRKRHWIFLGRKLLRELALGIGLPEQEFSVDYDSGADTIALRGPVEVTMWRDNWFFAKAKGDEDYEQYAYSVLVTEGIDGFATLMKGGCADIKHETKP